MWQCCTGYRHGSCAAMKKEDCKGEGSMENRSEEMKIWLFDVAHGNLTDEKGALYKYLEQ